VSLLLLALLAAGEPAVDAAKAEGRVVREGDVTRVEATIPGTVLGYAVPRGPAGRRELMVLAAPGPRAKAADGACRTAPVRASSDRKDGEIRLYRIDAAADPPLLEVRADLPADTRGLDAADVDGDGAQDLLLLRERRIDALLAPRFEGAARLVDETELDAYASGPWAIRSRVLGADPRWRLPAVGGLRTYGPSPDGGPFALLSEVPLPLRIWRKDFGIAISARDVTPLGTAPDGTTLLATEPEPVGKDRLRVSLLTPEARPDARGVDCWLRLPSPERVLDSEFLDLDGTPCLAVTTTSAEKLGLFSEKLLRLFPLRPDRTRKGLAPMFAVETRMNLWQAARFHATDVDGDGRRDLVVAYWKGLKHGTAVLDVYRRRPDGAFQPSERSQEIEMEAEDRSFLAYGNDVNGDGIPDLLLLAGGKLQVFAGRRDTREGRALVAGAPSLSTPVAGVPTGDTRMTMSFGPAGFSGEPERGSAGEPVVLDLDGDGTSEVLFVSRGDAEPGKIVIASFRGSAQAPR
jgi:hypothetical protein